MARQHMHNRRASRGSTGGGASWISYSDMMAALLLIFVLILTYSLSHYFSLLESKTAELEAQSAQLILAQEELEESRETLIVIQGDMTKLHAALIAQTAEAELRQQELDEAKAVVVSREEELASLQLVLLGQKEALEDAEKKLESQQLALNAQAKRIDSLIGVRSDIILALSNAFSASSMKATVDPTTGDIQLDSAVFFETGKSVIKEEGQQLLNSFIPVYLNVLLSPEYEDYLGQIIIEGHTDSSGSYTTNLKLSQDRALQVALYCLDMPGLNRAQKAKLQEILTATGRGWADLKYDAYGREDPEASRRVEFKFSLRDAEMIEEMNRILQGT